MAMEPAFHLLPHLPNLAGSIYRVTSPTDAAYNCLAWAANDAENWWWPDDDSYWPAGAPRTHTLEAFIVAYQSLGYGICDNSDSERGFEKIAIYEDSDGPQHAARQLADGTWSSKLGPWEDITHATLTSLECTTYGNAATFMKRPAIGVGSDRGIHR